MGRTRHSKKGNGESGGADSGEERVTYPKCAHCKKRPGTERWVGDGGDLAFVHGFYVMWCKRCCLEEQIKHAEDCARRIPEMKKELEGLKDESKSN